MAQNTHHLQSIVSLLVYKNKDYLEVYLDNCVYKFA